MRILLTIALLVFATPAIAQTATATDTQNRVAPVAPAPANPTTKTPLTQQQAATYYQSCLSRPDARLSPQTMDIFCQCTATYIQRNISTEEMVIASTPTNPGAGQVQNKIIMDVYAPCMEFPVRDLITAECTKTPALAANPQICPCLAKNMSQYTAQAAQANLGKMIQSGQPIGDIMNGLLETPEFKAAQQDIAMKCMTGAMQ